jgi:predicted nucleotidyltransferase
VKWLGLFGSYVKDAAHEDSDIDLLVEFEKLSFDNYMGLRIFLEDLFEKKIDLVISNSVKPRLKSLIEKEVEYVARL